MMTFSKKWALALLGTSALAVMPYADAEAREPVQSRSVQETTPSALPDAEIDGASIVAGIAACRKAIDADARVMFSFETTLATTTNGEQYFQGPFAYELQRSGTTRVKCLEDGAECQDLGADALEVGDGVVEVEVALRDLVGFSNPELCDTEATDMQHFVQIYVESSIDIGATPADYSEGRVVMDLIRPEAPALDTGLSTATKMRLSNMALSEDEDVESYFALVRTEPFEEGQLDEPPSSGQMAAIDVDTETGEGVFPVNLEEGTTAYVAVASRDEAGNYSLFSNDIEVDVIETDDFWDYYTDAGGSEMGGYGCASTGGTSTSLFALLMAALMLGFGRVRRARQAGARH